MKDKENNKKVKKVKLSAYGRKMARKERRKDSLFFMPSFLGVSVFYLVPFLVVLFYSIVDNPITKTMSAYRTMSEFSAMTHLKPRLRIRLSFR